MRASGKLRWTACVIGLISVPARAGIVERVCSDSRLVPVKGASTKAVTFVVRGNVAMVESECPSQVGRLHTTRRGPRLDVRWARCRTSRHVRLRAALTAGCDGGKITVWMKGRRVRYAAVRTASFEETPCPACR